MASAVRTDGRRRGPGRNEPPVDRVSPSPRRSEPGSVRPAVSGMSDRSSISAGGPRRARARRCRSGSSGLARLMRSLVRRAGDAAFRDPTAKLASRFAFDADTVWKHPANAKLRDARPNPNILFPGTCFRSPSRRHCGNMRSSLSDQHLHVRHTPYDVDHARVPRPEPRVAGVHPPGACRSDRPLHRRRWLGHLGRAGDGRQGDPRDHEIRRNAPVPDRAHGTPSTRSPASFADSRTWDTCRSTRPSA